MKEFKNDSPYLASFVVSGQLTIPSLISRNQANRKFQSTYSASQQDPSCALLSARSTAAR